MGGKVWKRLFVIGFGVLIVFIGIANGVILILNRSLICQNIATVPKAQAVLVLGARVHSNGRLSLMLEDRVLTGYDLYRMGKAEKILISGDHGQTSYDEVNSIRKYLLKLNVPPKDIFMDHAGFDTYDSLYRAKAIFKVKRMIIVTQRFHLPRAMFIARRMGLNATGFEADRHVYFHGPMIRSQFREALARTKAFLEVVVIHPKPKYLGDAIPITGDGQRTMDTMESELLPIGQ